MSEKEVGSLQGHDDGERFCLIGYYMDSFITKVTTRAMFMVKMVEGNKLHVYVVVFGSNSCFHIVLRNLCDQKLGSA